MQNQNENLYWVPEFYQSRKSVPTAFESLRDKLQGKAREFMIAKKEPSGGEHQLTSEDLWPY
jgi:hypothetical protein